MNPNAMKYGMIAAMAGLAGCGEVNANEQNTGALNTKETVVTNSDGSVTTTKREEREIKDDDGNVIGHESSVYTETVSADVAAARKSGDGAKAAAAKEAGAEGKGEAAAKEGEKAPVADSFLGLKFGEVPAGAEGAKDVPGEPAFKMVKFEPAKKLAGFDDYYAFVTPKSHKLVKVCACAKNEVESNVFGRRHYLVEALEKRYGVPARLASWIRPLYVLDIAPRRGVSICLSDAASDYETVITAWDDDAARTAASELRELRDESYRKAIEERNSSVNSAAEAF